MPGLLQTFFRRWRILPMVLPLRPEECGHRHPSDQNQSERKHGTSPAHPLARGFTDCNAPLSAEKIYAVREMPGRRDDADQVKNTCPPVLQFHLHFMKRSI